METNRLGTTVAESNPLGAYLRGRRARLDPTAFGFPPTRRRTPGLRREEVASLADVSATWYTWLEQGRGGAPSADVLDRIAGALRLTAVEREYLFLLAQSRPPEVRRDEDEGPETITPRLRRVLDSLESSPAVVKTTTTDVIGWNRAALAVLTDYEALAPEQRNLLRLLFCEPRVRAALSNWEDYVRRAVASFRADVARAGASKRAENLVDELSRRSPEFRAMWRDNDVCDDGEGTKHVRHPLVGPLAMDYSVFAVEGRPNLSLIILTPATPADAERIATLIRLHREASR